jgi:hypothetical protein
MPRTLRTVPGFFTAAGAGTNAATVSPGAVGTFAIDAFSSGNAYIEQVWASGATTDFVRIRSPRMHDANQGLRVRTGTVQNANLLPWGAEIQVYSSDVPTVEIDATGAGSGVVVLTYGYDDLSTGAPKLSMWSEIQSRIVDVMDTEVSVTSGAIGAYGVAAAINSSFDNFKADYSYALLGYTVSAAVACVSLNGPDTGNFDIGFPGDSDARETRDYFIRLSTQSGRASIPVIQANNRGGTVLKSVDATAAKAAVVSLTLARLS